MVGEGITQALSWLLAGDGEVAAVAAMTIQVSGVATLCSVLLGIPLGVWLALRDFRGKQLGSALVGLVFVLLLFDVEVHRRAAQHPYQQRNAPVALCGGFHTGGDCRESGLGCCTIPVLAPCVPLKEFAE